MELDLTKLREEINKTDKELLDLFKRRMEIAAGVAEYKRENGLPVLDAARERALLDRISDMAGGEFDGYARTLWRTMMDVSKAYQYTRLNPESVCYTEIMNALSSTSPCFPARADVACQGIEGAYSQANKKRVPPIYPQVRIN